MEQIIYCETDFGCFEIVGSEQGIKKVQLTENKIQKTKNILPIIEDCMAQLKAYFDGDLKDFEVKLDWEGATVFNKSVWEILLQIPYGHTTTYSAIADKLDNPKAVRAVGLANKYNPIAIIVPCHRVIAKSGDLQGYFYGLDMKRRLLELENPLSFARQGSLF